MSIKTELLHPELYAKVQKILAAMKALGFPMFITDGARTLQEQTQLYAKGRTLPGKIVTNADGVRVKSNHQVQADGYGHAVDCAFVDDPTTTKIETYDEKQPWELYGEMAEALGLEWGGRWKKPFDRPHVQLRKP